MYVSPEGHRDRMRQRLQQMTLEDVRSQDVLEYLLYYALPRRDTKQQAYDLLESFGSLQAVLNADENELTRVNGIGKRTARWLVTVGRAIAGYMQLEADDKPYMGNLASAVGYFSRFFAKHTDTEMWQFCLNAGGRLIGCMKLADYACWRTPEYMRMAAEQAVMLHAHSVLLCWFTGDRLIDVEDDEMAAIRNYGEALSISGMKLLDHIVFSREGHVSMARGSDRPVEQSVQEDAITNMRENARITGYLEGECECEYDDLEELLL